MNTTDTSFTGKTSENQGSEFTRHAIMAAIGCWIGFLLGPNVMVASTTSNYLAAVIEEWSNTEAISAALAAAPLTVAIMVPICGKLMDKFGIRTIILPGIILFGASFFVLGHVMTVWQFAVMQIILSLGTAMNSSVGFAKVVSSWFDKRRGIVLGTCVALGAGLGQTTMPKLSQWMIETWGWRGAFQGQALMIFCLSLPLVFFLVRPKKLGSDATVDEAADHNEAEDTPGLTVKEALRKPAFYKVFFAIMFGSMSLLGTMVFSRPIFAEQGFSVDWATTAASFAFAGVLLGEFTSGLLLDRWTTPRIVLIYFLIALAGVLTIHSLDGQSTTMLLLGTLMLGMGFGGEVGMNAYMISRYCGLKSFGTLYGFTFGASNLGIACGIYICGKVSAIYGSYENLFYIFGTTMLISALCVALLPKFVYMPDKHK